VVYIPRRHRKLWRADGTALAIGEDTHAGVEIAVGRRAPALALIHSATHTRDVLREDPQVGDQGPALEYREPLSFVLDLLGRSGAISPVAPTGGQLIQPKGILAVCALGAFALACNDQPTDLGPADLVIVQAPSTAGAPGWELIDTLVVRAVDPSGTPRAGVGVTWSVRQGGGSIAPTAETADADGYAKAVWTLGSTSGVNKVWASTAEGGQAEFQSMGEAFRVDRLASAWAIGCGLVSGSLWCWNFWAAGAPPSLHPGFGRSSASPSLVDDTHDFIDLAVRTDAVCALDPQLAVWCATRNQPAMMPQAGLPSLRSLISNGDGFGGDPLCGLAQSDSTAWCWQVGGASAQVPGSEGLARLWMAPGRACGLRTDSTAVCWGAALLGDGSAGPSDIPVAVSGGHRFVELAVSGGGFSSGFTCGRTAEHEIWCWGKGWSAGNDAPTPILLETNSYGVATNSWFVASFSLAQVMTIWEWDGALKRDPVDAKGLEGLPVARFSQNNHAACVVLPDGQVYCYDIMWDHSSAVPVDEYVPVQPVRSIPLTSPALK
jgi:hypothetical protein